MSKEKCECVNCCDAMPAKSKKYKDNLFQRIKHFFWRLFHSRDGEKKSNAWIDNEVKLAIAYEKSGSFEEGDDVFLKYAVSCIEAAGRIAKQFAKQGHSGMSAEITLELIRKLCSHTPLTALTGADDEWGDDEFDYGGHTYHLQNKRDSRVFKVVSEHGNKLISYHYNNILKIVNFDDVWKKYPPVDDPGTLDDDDEDVNLYFSEVEKLQDKLNSEITFPYTPVTHYYKWNFKKKRLEEVKD